MELRIQPSMIQELTDFYNVPVDDLIKAYNECYLINYGGVLLYGFIVDNITDEEKIFVFAYDSYLIPKHLERIQTLPFLSWKSPALDINLSGMTLDSLISKIKTKKSLLSGEKWNEITISVKNVNWKDIQEFVYEVQKNHHNVTTGPEKYFLNNGYKGYIHEGKVKDKDLFKLLWFTNGKDVCGTNILCTDDAELRKKYSPSTVGHFAVMKHSLLSGFEKCRFSLYFSYKKIFGVEPTMYPSIDYDTLMKLEKEGIASRFTEMELKGESYE